MLTPGNRERKATASAISAHIALHKPEFNIYIVQSAQFFLLSISTLKTV
jgi:hypothetical protein